MRYSGTMVRNEFLTSAELRQRYDMGDDPNDAEQQQQRQQGGHPFHGFHGGFPGGGFPGGGFPGGGQFHFRFT